MIYAPWEANISSNDFWSDSMGLTDIHSGEIGMLLTCLGLHAVASWLSFVWIELDFSSNFRFAWSLVLYFGVFADATGSQNSEEIDIFLIRGLVTVILALGVKKVFGRPGEFFAVLIFCTLKAIYLSSSLIRKTLLIFEGATVVLSRWLDCCFDSKALLCLEWKGFWALVPYGSVRWLWTSGVRTFWSRADALLVRSPKLVTRSIINRGTRLAAAVVNSLIVLGYFGLNTVVGFRTFIDAVGLAGIDLMAGPFLTFVSQDGFTLALVAVKIFNLLVIGLAASILRVVLGETTWLWLVLFVEIEA